MVLTTLQQKISAPQTGVFDQLTFLSAMKFYKMTPERAAHFFGQCSVESGGFKIFEENLNYSADGLKKIFPSHFPGDTTAYAHQPEKIANHVYENRNGNGPESTGDGWKYRGRGAIQLTGKMNYKLFSDYIKMPEIMTNPDLVSSTYAIESAKFFFDHLNLWTICDQGVTDDAIKQLTKRINGGYTALDERSTNTKKFYEWTK